MPPPPPPPGTEEANPDYKFLIDEKTPASQLVPDAPAGKPAPVYLGDDLSRVPEVALEAPPSKPLAKPGQIVIPPPAERSGTRIRL